MFRTLVACALAAFACTGFALAQDGLFSGAQADRGGVLFDDECSACHTVRHAADLMVSRGGDTLFPEFHAKLSATMPPFSADKPEPQGYVDILAYLTRADRWTALGTPRPTRSMPLTSSRCGQHGAGVLPAWVLRPRRATPQRR